jgi:hypothetical protein
MEIKDKEAIITLFTYIVMCNEKSGYYGHENQNTPRLFAEFYYENAVTNCMMNLMVDENGTVKSACRAVVKHFDENFRRYLFAELVRFAYSLSDKTHLSLKLIYNSLDLHDRSFEQIMEILFGESVLE